jgi:predicted RNase H-like HicB family nuclease
MKKKKKGYKMIQEYIKTAIQNAEYKKLEDNTWFGEIPGYEGVWANADKLEECRNELIEVLEDWLLLKIKDGDPIPKVSGVEIKIKEKVLV